MSETFFMDLSRIDEEQSTVTVEYTYSAGCPSNGWDEPGWGPEIEIVKAFNDAGDVPHTDEEDNKWCEIIADKHEPGDDYEYDLD